MRLIDADALSTKVIFVCEDGYDGADMVLKKDIDNAPTIEAEPVKHGRWVFGTVNFHEYMKCSECLKSQEPTGVFSYCPNCGAKMGGE